MRFVVNVTCKTETKNALKMLIGVVQMLRVLKKGQHRAKYEGCKEVKEILCFVDRAFRYNHVKKKHLLDFKLSPCSECLCLLLLLKIEQTECFETSACKIQTPRNYPGESMQQKKSNLMHNSFLLYFFNFYTFRACLCPSSGGTTVCIQQWVLIILFR